MSVSPFPCFPVYGVRTRLFPRESLHAASGMSIHCAFAFTFAMSVLDSRAMPVLCSGVPQRDVQSGVNLLLACGVRLQTIHQVCNLPQVDG
jgi:hypothetical protein